MNMFMIILLTNIIINNDNPSFLLAKLLFFMITNHFSLIIWQWVIIIIHYKSYKIGWLSAWPSSPLSRETTVEASRGSTPSMAGSAADAIGRRLAALVAHEATAEVLQQHLQAKMQQQKHDFSG